MGPRQFIYNNGCDECAGQCPGMTDDDSDDSDDSPAGSPAPAALIIRNGGALMTGATRMEALSQALDGLEPRVRLAPHTPNDVIEFLRGGEQLTLAQYAREYSAWYQAVSQWSEEDVESAGAARMHWQRPMSHFSITPHQTNERSDPEELYRHLFGDIESVSSEDLHDEESETDAGDAGSSADDDLDITIPAHPNHQVKGGSTLKYIVGAGYFKLTHHLPGSR